MAPLTSSFPIFRTKKELSVKTNVPLISLLFIFFKSSSVVFRQAHRMKSLHLKSRFSIFTSTVVPSRTESQILHHCKLGALPKALILLKAQAQAQALKPVVYASLLQACRKAIEIWLSCLSVFICLQQSSLLCKEHDPFFWRRAIQSLKGVG